MTFHFGQIKIGSTATCQQFPGVMKHEQRKVENTTTDALTIDQGMFFIQMPAAWPHHQRRHLVIESIHLAILFQRNRTPHRIAQIDLSLNLIVPIRGIAILEIGHVRIRTRVQGIDNHLAFHRPGNLDPTTLQVSRQRCNRPVTFANRAGRGQKIRALACIQSLDALGTCL